MVVRKLYESQSNITLGWTPPEGAEYYLFYAAGKRVSNAPAIDKNGRVKTQIQFSKVPEGWEIVCITRKAGVMGTDVGKYPPVAQDDPTYGGGKFAEGGYGN